MGAWRSGPSRKATRTASCACRCVWWVAVNCNQGAFDCLAVVGNGWQWLAVVGSQKTARSPTSPPQQHHRTNAQLLLGALALRRTKTTPGLGGRPLVALQPKTTLLIKVGFAFFCVFCLFCVFHAMCHTHYTRLWIWGLTGS